MARDAHHADEIRTLMSTVATTPPQQALSASVVGLDGVSRKITVHSHWFEVSHERTIGEGEDTHIEVVDDGRFFYGTGGAIYRLPAEKEPTYAKPPEPKPSPTAKKK